MYSNLCKEKLKKVDKDIPLSTISDHDLVMVATGCSSEKADEVLSVILSNPESVGVGKLGLTPARDKQFRAAYELSRRMFGTGKRVNSPRDIFPLIMHYATLPQEQFIVVYLSGAHTVLGVETITQGLVNRTMAHPREVFAPAIEKRSCAIIIAHNHPSGNLEPSPEDLEITRRLVQAGEYIGIQVLDHLVFTLDGFYSFTEHGIIEPKTD